MALMALALYVSVIYACVLSVQALTPGLQDFPPVKFACASASGVHLEQLAAQVAQVSFDTTYEALPYSIGSSVENLAVQLQSIPGGVSRVSLYLVNNKQPPASAAPTTTTDTVGGGGGTTTTISNIGASGTSGSSPGSSGSNPGSGSGSSTAGSDSGSASGSSGGVSGGGSSSLGKAVLLSQLSSPAGQGTFTAAALYGAYLAVARTLVTPNPGPSGLGGGQLIIYDSSWVEQTQVWVCVCVCVGGE